MAATALRKEYDTPIIFLTAYSSESDKVMGFSMGADDYIVKPFSNVELLMRVKSILRIASVHSAPIVQQVFETQPAFQDVVLDIDNQSVIKNGEVVAMIYTEFS